MDKPTKNRLVAVMATSLLIVGLLLATGAAWATAQERALSLTDAPQALEKAFAYLKANQLADGGIVGWTPGDADEFATIKTVLATASAGYPMEYISSISDRTPLDFLGQRAITYTHDLSQTLFPGRAGMLAVAVVAGNADPTDFGGMDLISELLSSYHEATGAFSTTAKLGLATGMAGTVNQVWAILGLAAAQQTIPEQAMGFLVSLQESDGGWGYGFGGDVDLTSVVVQALVAGGLSPTSEPVLQGLDFLRQKQHPSGGWAAWGSFSPDSTAAAIQALAAAGYAPAGSTWQTDTGGTPLQALLDMQGEDGGFINTIGTAHAIPGLTETPLPILGRVGRANRALTWLGSLQAADGSWAGWSGGDPGLTSDAILAYVAAGYDPDTVIASDGITSALGYLAASAADYVALSPDRAGKLTLAAMAGGADPGDLGGIDLADAIMQHYSPTVGAFGATGTYTNTWYQSLAILGLAATGHEVPAAAVQNLLSLQQADGGWRYDLSPSPWAGVNAENTSLAIQALVAGDVPVTHTAMISATAFLRAEQDASAGWDGNANATAAGIQGLLALGEDLTTWSRHGYSPYDALLGFQKANGPFVWMWDDPWSGPADNAMATTQAIQALLGLSLADVTSRPLQPFVPVGTGPNPNRLVIGSPRVERQAGAALIRVPYSSDVNRNGRLDLDWRKEGMTDWITGTVTARVDGHLQGAVPLESPVLYHFRATLTDPEGVQYQDILTPSVTIHVTLEPERVYLPAVMTQ